MLLLEVDLAEVVREVGFLLCVGPWVCKVGSKSPGPVGDGGELEGLAKEGLVPAYMWR